VEKWGKFKFKCRSLRLGRLRGRGVVEGEKGVVLKRALSFAEAFCGEAADENPGQNEGEKDGEREDVHEWGRNELKRQFLVSMTGEPLQKGISDGGDLGAGIEARGIDPEVAGAFVLRAGGLAIEADLEDLGVVLGRGERGFALQDGMAKGA
jgi:hypothetical protein